MGHLTSITIHNDALHEFQKHPKEFAEAVFEGIHKANREHTSVDIPFNGYVNYIKVHHSRHADDETLYVHKGNSVYEFNPYSNEFRTNIKKKFHRDYLEKTLKFISSFVKEAKFILKATEGVN